MIWLTWRQFRVQALVTAAALVVLAGYLLLLGHNIRHSYDTDIVACQPANCAAAVRAFTNRYTDQIQLVAMVLIAAPALIGLFWGAPLVTRELEERTDKLVWGQSVTRTRWLAVKLGLLALAGALTTGLLSLLLTWSASRFDQVEGGRFGALNFATRNVVPIGYALFALALGTVVGLVVHRTVPAIAVTLAIFAVVQILVPHGIRQHLMPPVTSTVTLDVAAFQRTDGFNVGPNGGSVDGYYSAGTWSMTSRSALYKPDGSRFGIDDAQRCMTGKLDSDQACLANLHLTFRYTYQPANRYWPFQWIELSGFLALALLLTGLGFWWIRHRLT